MITGQDLISQLKEKELGEVLLLPCNMFRSEEDVFLDDVTLAELGETLQVRTYIVKSSGQDSDRSSITGREDHEIQRGMIMSKPVVAVVGRPNVGKSTLFNVLAGEMISIVKDTPGVTRDRIYADVSWLDKEFTLIDTGGIEPDSRDVILSQMREQAQIAIDTADVIIFITDVRQGLVGCGFQGGGYAETFRETGGAGGQ